MLIVIVDFHTHVFSPKANANREKYCAYDACFKVLYSNPSTKLRTAEDLVASMDECGIGKSVVLNIGWVNQDLCIESNEYILESVSKYPDRLVGFCSIQPLEKRGALKELERCLSNGAKGVGELRPDIQGFDLYDVKLMQPLIEMLIEKNSILLLHSSEPVGHRYQGKGDLTPGILYKFIEMYPKLKVVLAHWGGGLPFYELMPEVAMTLMNTSYDTAATLFLYRLQIFKYMVDIVGSKKILYGSDWPLLDQQKIKNQMDSAGLSDFERENICYRNAFRVLGMGE